MWIEEWLTLSCWLLCLERSWPRSVCSCFPTKLLRGTGSFRSLTALCKTLPTAGLTVLLRHVLLSSICMGVILAFLSCESLTLLWDPDTIIPQPVTGPFATVGRRARDVVCRLLAPKSRRQLRREATVPSTRQQPVSDLQKVSSGQLCISILCICLQSGFFSELSYEEGVFNWSKFTWYLESCTINL